MFSATVVTENIRHIPSQIFTSFCAIFQQKLGNNRVFCILRCLSLTHLDMSSFKLIRIAAVNDDDLFNYMIKLASESCHHLKTTQNILYVFKSSIDYCDGTESFDTVRLLTMSEVMYLRSWCFPSTVGRTKG